MLKTARFGSTLLAWNNKLIFPIVVFMASITIYILNMTTLEIFIYGVPNCLLLTIAATYCCNIIFHSSWSFILFVLIWSSKLIHLGKESKKWIEIEIISKLEEFFSHLIHSIIRSMNITLLFVQNSCLSFGWQLALILLYFFLSEFLL